MAIYSKNRKANKRNFINFKIIRIGYPFKALGKGFTNYKKILLFGSKVFKEPEINYLNNLKFIQKVIGKYKINKFYLAES